jgi:hypothetical protein
MGLFDKKKLVPVEIDPSYSHMVGRLVGATEMLVRYMILQGDEPARGMAARVEEVIAWFTEGEFKPFTEKEFLAEGVKTSE